MRHAGCTGGSLAVNAANAGTCHSRCAPGTGSRSPSQRVLRAFTNHLLPAAPSSRPERGLARVRAQALDMVTQRGYSRRSVAHIAADLHSGEALDIFS